MYSLSLRLCLSTVVSRGAVTREKLLHIIKNAEAVFTVAEAERSLSTVGPWGDACPFLEERRSST